MPRDKQGAFCVFLDVFALCYFESWFPNFSSYSLHLSVRIFQEIPEATAEIRLNHQLPIIPKLIVAMKKRIKINAVIVICTLSISFISLSFVLTRTPHPIHIYCI